MEIPLPTAGNALLPSPLQVGLAGILDLFAEEAVLGPQFFFAHFEDMRTLAVMLRHLPLGLRESYLFCLAPCDPADTAVATALARLWGVVCVACVGVGAPQAGARPV